MPVPRIANLEDSHLQDMEMKGVFWVIFSESTAAAAAAASLQSCPTLWDPIDRSPPGSFVHGTFQARALEWDAIAFSAAGVLNDLSSGV